MFSSVRARLTAWYVAALGVVLLASSVGVYILLAQSLYDRLDSRLGSTLQAATAALKHTAFEQAEPAHTVIQALEDLRFPNQTIAVLDAGGRVIAQKTAPGGPPLRLPTSPFNPSENIRFYELPESQPDSDDSCRGVFQQVTNGSTAASYVVVVMQSLEPLSDQLDLLLGFLYIVVPLSLCLAGLGGWLLARKSLAPVMVMAERAQRISIENLDQRLPIANPDDELGRLAATFNELLLRLSKSFVQQRQFMADASHELRTPLSVMRTAATVMLQREDREKCEYREALTIVEQQGRRLTRIVEDMFVLARADAGHPAMQSAELYLDELLTETARTATMLASQRKVQVHIPSLPEAPFRGDECLLRQMTWNLLDNAIKYTPEGGSIGIALESHDKEYVISISDTGPGIPPEAQLHIFKRFYRADQARSPADQINGSGAGLGLPIARWIAEAHHGHLELQDSDQSGSTFVVFLPST